MNGQEDDFKKNFRKGIKGIVRHSKKYKKEFIILLFLGFVSALSNALVPFVTGGFFDSLINLSDNNSLYGVPTWAFFLIVLAIIQIVVNITNWFINKIKDYTNINIHMDIQANGYAHFLRLPISFHKNEHIQGLIQKISTAGWRVSNIISSIVDLAPQILSVFIGLTLVITINYNLVLILMIGVFVYLVLLIKILNKAAKIDHEAHEYWSVSYDQSIEPITQIDSVKQSVAEDYESKRIFTIFKEKTMELWRKLDSIWNNVTFFQSMVVFLTQISIFISSVSLISNGLISVGDLIAVNGYSLMFFGPFVQLGYSWQNFQNGITAAAHAEEVFEQDTEIYNPENAVSKEILGNIEFRDVNFSYEDNQQSKDNIESTELEEIVLKNVNLKINQGESVALVGKSGSGKSTFVSLVSGYYFPNHGEVLIDETKTSQYNLFNLRQQIAVVPQEIALFNDTIENNIKYGCFDATFEDIKKAAKEAFLEEFINQQKDGYKTLVGERGVKLSVGQKQRLAIARAILRNPKILILDEPTSALDSMTEKFVTESLTKLMKDRTTIIIAHRLSTVRKADKIVVFEDGEIVESGNHEKLLKKNDGYYKKLHDYQIGIY